MADLKDELKVACWVVSKVGGKVGMMVESKAAPMGDWKAAW